ncbi:histone-like nucleoid-structuring protein Lsr2 [Streptomyces sp. NPDC050509]|uniref:Lsr2 family DNA-binding protein n=1 Tax=Streptomyces sp. NPDC050509 TaxID=3365620 RepID=UPI003792AA55
MADRLEGVSRGSTDQTAKHGVGSHRPEGEAIRLWARANGYLVNDHGRIPSTIREAYEASR